MKKIFTAVILVSMVWSCTKKMTPAKSETPTAPASNTGSVINQPATSENKSAVITNTNEGPTGNTGITGTKTADTRTRSAEETAAISGQATFNAKCGRCHGLKVAGDYTVERWVNIMAVMAPRANLTETEKANVLEYVKANAKK